MERSPKAEDREDEACEGVREAGPSASGAPSGPTGSRTSADGAAAGSRGVGRDEELGPEIGPELVVGSDLPIATSVEVELDLEAENGDRALEAAAPASTATPSERHAESSPAGSDDDAAAGGEPSASTVATLDEPPRAATGPREAASATGESTAPSGGAGESGSGVASAQRAQRAQSAQNGRRGRRRRPSPLDLRDPSTTEEWRVHVTSWAEFIGKCSLSIARLKGFVEYYKRLSPAYQERFEAEARALGLTYSSSSSVAASSSSSTSSSSSSSSSTSSSRRC
ncbi:t29.3 [Tupaiid betaherpesvirus 1]|uniref:T29.3 n=1 Tax=Tupaiid herpesvirus 1 (strain 1) TaxID=10397 RepID=Q91TR4_TUHV1|nr:t29.3 [Tupaiid betaherpesvirus 1]AAK57073.1 t29.3 [Tupaiid betaherpesvirus 1]